MITFKLFFTVLLFTNCVLCRDTRRGNTRHRQKDEVYKFNHPPEPESYEPIPVAVVYEEDINRNDKSIKSEVATTNNIEPEKKDPPKNETSATREPSSAEEENKDLIDSIPVKEQSKSPSSDENDKDKSIITLMTNYKQDLQIPVAVVYEPEAPYYNQPHSKSQRISSKRRKVQRPSVEEKKIEEDDQTETSVMKNDNTHIRVVDTQERLNNNEKSSLGQSFAKRDNSTRQREVVPIIQSENLVFSHTGDFQYSYEGGDGTKAFEKGQLKTFDDDNAGEAVSGGFSYTAKDGNEYSLSYTADENGYRPVGAHLPTPPPIPPAIARALAYLATKTTPEPVTESLIEADYS